MKKIQIVRYKLKIVRKKSQLSFFYSVVNKKINYAFLFTTIKKNKKKQLRLFFLTILSLYLTIWIFLEFCEKNVSLFYSYLFCGGSRLL